VPGAANVYRLDPTTGIRTIAYSGFTNIIDLTFGADGNLYVLQISRDGLASPTGPVPGALIKVDPVTGTRTTIASQGLNFPGGVAVGPDGALYVTNFGTTAGAGQVLRIVIPEPSGVLLLGLGTLGLVALRVRKRGR
jgi:DNA-binding beta-propeller fold protein YncE